MQNNHERRRELYQEKMAKGVGGQVAYCVKTLG